MHINHMYILKLENVSKNEFYNLLEPEESKIIFGLISMTKKPLVPPPINYEHLYICMPVI